MKLIVLVGLPASGKSTFAQNYCKENKNAMWISSDNVRELLYGDASIQGDNHKVFDTMYRLVIEALTFGHDVVYDSTNISLKERRSIINFIKNNKKLANEVQIEAKMFVMDLEKLKERNRARDRVVPEFVYKKMLARFTPPMEFEGFSKVEYIYFQDSFSEYGKCFSSMINFNQYNPHHTLTLEKHCEKAAAIARSYGYPQILSQALLYHDCGKPYCQTFDEKNIAHYFSHACYGAYFALCAKEVAEEDADRIYIAALISYHMDPYNKAAWPKIKEKLPNFFVRDLEIIHQCDVGAH